MFLLAETGEDVTKGVSLSQMRRRDYVKVKSPAPLPLDWEGVYYYGVSDEPNDFVLQLRFVINAYVAVFRVLKQSP